MSPNTWWSWAIVCIAGTLLAASPAAAQCQYDVTVIQAPDVCGILGPVITIGMGLNENGAVVGRWNCPASEHDDAFIWTPDSGLTTLARPTGIRSAIATDISDDGVIVGTYIVTNVGSRGYVYDNGRFTELPTLTGAGWSKANAINGGRVVGLRSIGEGLNPSNAFIWSAADGFTDLGVLNGPNSGAMDLNAVGKVVGWTGIIGGADEAFLWEDGVLTLLGPIPGGFTSLPWAINNARQVCGSGLIEVNGETLVRSFLWQDGKMTDLGVLPGYDICGAVDLNDQARVVGSCRKAAIPHDRVAFIWHDGAMKDLNSLIDRQSNFVLVWGRAINSAGQIVAEGVGPTGIATVLLTPIKPPLGDLDGDCRVRVPDLLSLLAAWGRCSRRSGCPADLNNDGTVNQLDLVLLIENWG